MDGVSGGLQRDEQASTSKCLKFYTPRVGPGFSWRWLRHAALPQLLSKRERSVLLDRTPVDMGFHRHCRPFDRLAADLADLRIVGLTRFQHELPAVQLRWLVTVTDFESECRTGAAHLLVAKQLRLLALRLSFSGTCNTC